jgi:hypothetical protein
MSGALGCIASYVATEVVQSWCDAWRDELIVTSVSSSAANALMPNATDISLTQSYSMVAVQEVRDLTLIYAKQGDTLDLIWNDHLKCPDMLGSSAQSPHLANSRVAIILKLSLARGPVAAGDANERFNTLTEAFKAKFGHEPELFTRAPGLSGSPA